MAFLNHDKYLRYFRETLRLHGKANRLVLSDEKTEPIHVIANGPTFRDTCKYIDQIPGKTMMCNFALNSFELFVPDYYVFADPAFLCIDPDYRGEMYYYVKETNSDQEELFEKFHQLREKLFKIDKKMSIICPAGLNFEQSICNPNLSWIYVNTPYIPIDIKGALKRWKENRAAPRIQGIIVLEIFAALQLGYKTIYLHGCEQSNIYGGALKMNQDNNKISYMNSHFYEKNYEVSLKGVGMLEALRAEEILFTSLYELQDYSKHLNARIINMSKNSWVDCFERYIEERR